MTKPTIGIGILSWRAHNTLHKSLQSYQQNGFLPFFDQKMIYFSDISADDKALADEFGWDYAGGPNEGIAGGTKRLAENMTTDYMLLLQNDNPIIESREFAEAHLAEAIALLESGRADIICMRHRWHVGEGFGAAWKYLKYFPARKLSENFEPEYHPVSAKNYKDSFKKKILRVAKWFRAKEFIGRSLFVEENPEEIHPRYIHKDGNFWIFDSAVMHYTDQCLLVKKDFFMKLMDFMDKHPSSRIVNGFQAPETCINGKWWRNSHFKWGQGLGIFTHARHDGSFRKHHQFYEA